MAISTQYSELTTFVVNLYADFQPQGDQKDGAHAHHNSIKKVVNFQRRSGDRHLFAIIHEAVRATILGCLFRSGLRRSPPIDCRNWQVANTSEPHDNNTMFATIHEALSLQQKDWQPHLRLHGLQVLVALAKSPQYRPLLRRIKPRLRDAITESLFNCGEDLQVMGAFLSYTLRQNGIYLNLNLQNLASQMEQAGTCHFESNNHTAFCKLGLRLALHYLLFTPEEQKSQGNIPEEHPDAADFMSSEDDDEAMEPFSGLQNDEMIGEPDETSDEDNDKPVKTVEEEELDQPTQEDLDFIVDMDDSRGDEEYRPEEEDQTSGSDDSDDDASSQEEDY